MTPQSAKSHTTDEVLERLEILWRKLESDGMYVQANTVALAIDEIKRLMECPPPNTKPRSTASGFLRSGRLGFLGLIHALAGVGLRVISLFQGPSHWLCASWWRTACR